MCSGEEQSQPRHDPSYENGWKTIARACVDSASEVVWNSDGSIVGDTSENLGLTIYRPLHLLILIVTLGPIRSPGYLLGEV